jgi:hypothetical protein
MYTEPDKGLQEAVALAVEQYAWQAGATREEKWLIANAMKRALNVVLRYQQEHQPTKR